MAYWFVIRELDKPTATSPNGIESLGAIHVSDGNNKPMAKAYARRSLRIRANEKISVIRAHGPVQEKQAMDAIAKQTDADLQWSRWAGSHLTNRN